ncbi:hypothetical protein LGH83_13695 [Lichenihabitans sp. PAMC28606]|uniref:hypothetical protein n=1 Tax=Lichenihabitans sp. PAMC28606 TaxID=2880932 RepID=UPI001D0B1453|nr:hypothetical protein [Lichenihabitans sp. PAMC28606]UDL93617.1 hypothetical protein LGH83_13695 [Lichenihabitans sp. PAMC28606]
MSENGLTPRQTLLVWSLLGQRGQALQGAILPEVVKADREQLEARRLIKVSRQARGALLLQLDDKGWAWAAAHLTDAVPPAYQVLRAWLGLLSAHLEQHGETLAEFVGPLPEGAEPLPRSPRAAGRSASARALTPVGMRRKIGQAYLAITGGKTGESALLRDIRAHLSAFDRVTVDDALGRILAGDKKARLMRINNPNALTAADREAAYDPAGEPFHVLWIMP